VNAREARHKLQVAATLLGTGMLAPTRPDKAVRSLAAVRRWGPTSAAAYLGSAIRHPDRMAIVDERGTLTFGEVHKRTNALARGLRQSGVGEGDGVAIMCRNHRGFIEATVACSKLGVNALYLNTAFAGPQIADVLAREDPVAVIYDDEFAALVDDGAASRKRFIAWTEPSRTHSEPLLEELSSSGQEAELEPPLEKGRVVILTSGTTGTPKGAARKQPDSIDPAASLFSKIPLHARETTVIAAPMFHSWGFGHFTLSLPLASTLVLHRRFDPEETLQAVAQHRASTLVLVPVMLHRILELGATTIARYDTSCLRVIALSGSALPGELATRAMDTFGDVLYNLYGSTEVAWGRIFVGNEMVFDGYTGGGGKQIIGGLMSTGDMGRFDAAGRLFVEGRDDEMIISGGENVFPREIEDLLAEHPKIEEVAVIGVPDADFGQRLKAFVVVREGERLSEQDVQEHVKANLARFKVPREVSFLRALPRNATGKVLKRELSELGDAAPIS
jgi:acyl-CoA synthetase (AMP-forming)/AMP-acid ligase II